MMSVAQHCKRLVGILERFSWIAPLVTRIVLGVVFIESGWGKIHNIEKVIGFFTDLGIPAAQFQAYLVAYTEFICGTAILLGFLTRIASVPLLVTMVVALLTAKKNDIQVITDVFGISEFLYIVLFIWLIFEGSGCVSVDAICSKKLK